MGTTLAELKAQDLALIEVDLDSILSLPDDEWLEAKEIISTMSAEYAGMIDTIRRRDRARNKRLKALREMLSRKLRNADPG